MIPHVNDSILRLDGMTSLGVPGITGVVGNRGKVFFYGNSLLEDSDDHSIIIFKDIDDESETYKWVPILEDVVPVSYDYILYTEKNIDYVYVIINVAAENDNYTADVKLVEKIILPDNENENENSDIEFTITWSKQNWARYTWNGTDYDEVEKTLLGYRERREPEFISPTYIPGYEAIYKYKLKPVQTMISDNNDFVDFIVTCPSNTRALLKNNIKIVIEFYTLQASFMDTNMTDKFTSKTNYDWDIMTYRGYLSSYDIFEKKYMNFDDEHLEKFTIVVKDFDEGNGTNNTGQKSFIKTITFPTKPIKRCLDAAKNYNGKLKNEAKIFAYIKNGYFIDKIYIGDLDLSELVK